MLGGGVGVRMCVLELADLLSLWIRIYVCFQAIQITSVDKKKKKMKNATKTDLSKYYGYVFISDYSSKT